MGAYLWGLGMVDMIDHAGCRALKIFGLVHWRSSCSKTRIALGVKGCGVYPCGEVRRFWCGGRRREARKSIVCALMLECSRVFHMGGGWLRMVQRLSFWGTGGELGFFASVQHGLGMRSERIIHGMC